MLEPWPDAAALRAWRDATLYRLVLRASQAERRETLARLRQHGFADVTHADTALLASLDTADTTISVLARRCGITRQAASQQIALLEHKGYVTREPDPGDSRATLVQRTARGHALLAAALKVVADIEAEYAEHLGAERLAALKEILADLLTHSDPAGALGADLSGKPAAIVGCRAGRSGGSGTG